MLTFIITSNITDSAESWDGLSILYVMRLMSDRLHILFIECEKAIYSERCMHDVYTILLSSLLTVHWHLSWTFENCATEVFSIKPVFISCGLNRYIYKARMQIIVVLHYYTIYVLIWFVWYWPLCWFPWIIEKIKPGKRTENSDNLTNYKVVPALWYHCEWTTPVL
jgi:hypothetical protein